MSGGHTELFINVPNNVTSQLKCHPIVCVGETTTFISQKCDSTKIKRILSCIST